MFDRHIELCNQLIDRFDKYINHIENNISNRSDDYLDRLPRNELVLQSDLIEFFDSTDEILTEVYGKESSEYAKWVNIKNNHFDIDRERAYKNAEFREKQGGYYGNILLSELSKVQRDCVNQTVKLLADLELKYQLQQDKLQQDKENTPKIDFRYAQIHGGLALRDHTSNVTYNYTSEQKQTLAEAAAEIQKLLQQLEQTNPAATEDDMITHVNDETTPSFKRKAVAALKAAGGTAFDEFLGSYAKVGKAAIMAWMKPGED